MKVFQNQSIDPVRLFDDLRSVFQGGLKIGYAFPRTYNRILPRNFGRGRHEQPGDECEYDMLRGTSEISTVSIYLPPSRPPEQLGWNIQTGVEMTSKSWERKDIAG